jgi:hypothetical protein
VTSARKLWARTLTCPAPRLEARNPVVEDARMKSSHALPRTTISRLLSALLLALVVGACSDAPTGSPRNLSPALTQAEATNALANYVAIGTSVSMGVQSSGANASTQRESWAAQLAARAGTPLELPLISGFGCKAPIASPIALGIRISGEPLSTPDSLLNCDPLLPGIDLPTRNVAIDGATTQEAVYGTPQTVNGVFKKKLWSRVLPPSTTMLHAALMRRPTVVSVELGANEVLGATSGIAIPGVSMVPPSVWMPTYDALVDTLQMHVPRGVLVGLIRNAASFPSFRYGYEIWADAPTLLAAFHVNVLSDCNGSQNLVFVAVRIPTAVATGAAYKKAGLPPYNFSCADLGTGVRDYVLTPADVALVNSYLNTMTAHIRASADRRGLAFFALDELYGMPTLKPPFSSVALMTSPQPYGAYISLDGVHPSPNGHAILANAAARALNQRYRMRIPDASTFIAAR